ncbi:DMSO/TMAO reductase YedYZ heme-binding membrane subunit [Actinomadura hallensis]|uniref:DMSO/TMAO reductase YedYZ heme-binding membrane subunit n=1 Tax=Actinomadura hallensis TaxID=337895 RepID=A0A543IHT7_9ACTN|nr:hypothetical protein [Actinomadura hallensis]TQM70141.1 DMSO/TMAO reductase YedYZ heme-binding membrane subunit [Actinomadura hallensis]HLV72591.1 hypothetical protein [Vulgatibacteraceae bacterium]
MRIRNSDDPMVPTWALRLVIAGAVLVLVGAATPQGAVAVANVQYFLNFFAGVFALVSLTVAVVSGLLATERLILKIRHRVLAQALHRAAAIVSVAMLIAHVSVKVMAGLALPASIVIPSAGAVGLGTIAFDLMFVIVVSGLVRARFASRGKVWMWRSVHVLAYAAWPFAIVHGLTAGRAAANWVVLSYVMSVVFVVLALMTRLIVVVKPRELNRIDDEIGAFSRPDGAGRRRDRRAMAAMEHEEARAAAAARAREADPLSALDDPRGTVQDPRGMPVYGGGDRDTEVYR